MYVGGAHSTTPTCTVSEETVLRENQAVCRAGRRLGCTILVKSIVINLSLVDDVQTSNNKLKKFCVYYCST